MLIALSYCFTPWTLLFSISLFSISLVHSLVDRVLFEGCRQLTTIKNYPLCGVAIPMFGSTWPPLDCKLEITSNTSFIISLNHQIAYIASSRLRHCNGFLSSEPKLGNTALQFISIWLIITPFITIGYLHSHRTISAGATAYRSKITCGRLLIKVPVQHSDNPSSANHRLPAALCGLVLLSII